MDPYVILGLTEDANAVDVRRAYLRKVKLHHPDCGGDRRSFSQVVEAYRRLGGHRVRRRVPEGMKSERPRGASTDSAASPNRTPHTENRAQRVKFTSTERPRRRSRRLWQSPPSSYSVVTFPGPVWSEDRREAWLLLGFLALWCTAVALTAWVMFSPREVQLPKAPAAESTTLESPKPPPKPKPKSPPKYIDMGPDTVRP
jgi:hypothetical protein